MGSHSIDTYVKKDERNPTPEKAFDNLYEHDRAEFGYDAYSGSWGTVQGTHKAQGTSPMTRTEAHRHMEDALERLSKWDDCEYVEILGDTASRTITVNIDEAAWRKFTDYNDRPNRLAAIEPLVKLKAGEYIASADAPGWNGDAKRTEKRRVRVWPTEGDGVTRYFLVSVKDSYNRGVPEWSHGFASQSDARKELDRRLRSYDPNRHLDSPELEIIGIRRRANGEGLVKGISEVVTSSTPIKVTIKTRGTAVIGWFFYGWAAS